MENTFYDTETLAAMESFHRVWSRVTGPSLPPARSEPFIGLLATLCLLHRHYAVLAGLFSRGPKTTLRHMAQETAQHYRRLLAEFYLREGRLWTPESKKLPRTKRELLRSAYLLEAELIESAGQNACGENSVLINAAIARRDAAKKLLIACF